MFYVADLVQDKVNCIPQNLLLGDSLWIQEFLVKDTRVMPSEILRHYFSLRNEQPSYCFEYSMALINSWIKMIKSRNNRSGADTELKEAVQQDLRTHGLSLYQDVVIGFACSYVHSKDHMLNVIKNVEEAYQQLFKKLELEFSWVLEQFPTFNRAKLATMQLNQKLIQPDVISSRQ